jgi:hypothetical protein
MMTLSNGKAFKEIITFSQHPVATGTSVSASEQ